ncbi:hypothetical protein SH580_05590 [Coraliomargarita algicola]|uniref:Uncharacterized protein n=1 Tax=Coraliomargarita algicola TaxID=3092156 RepID=A0ABZ0RQC7_9BACT|nr:hypothetical protein [Coraliomargarita sp. J2-16]WPJ97180.1 hypothetical protein SH580_05590 [Coraliomargarita sp. J2-16]
MLAPRCRYVGGHAHVACEGFALVIALSLMAFVVVLLLSVSALIRVEQTSSSAHMNRMEAEQAAILSLNLAIGQLQQSAGLDQRVTAPAEALAGVNGPQQLTGVWRSWEGSDHEAEGLPIAPNYDAKLEAGNLNSEVAASNEGRFLSWLVSTVYDPADTSTYDAETLPSLVEVTSGANQTVPLLSAGSVLPGEDPISNREETAADVEVHLRPTQFDNGQASFAWWISGINRKALVKESQDPSDVAGWSRRLVSHGRADPEVFGLEDDATLGRLASQRSFDLQTSSGAQLSQQYFHDLTSISRGLLSNTATGGWRRDLSLMAEQWNTASLPLTELPVFTAKPFTEELSASLRLRDYPEDASIYPWVTSDGISMSWHALMDFVSLYKKVQTNEASGEPYFDAVVTNNSDWISILPIFARAHFAFGYDAIKTTSTDAEGNALYRPRFLFKPAITMWNPYNVAIESKILSEFRFEDETFPINLYATVGEQKDLKVNIQKMISGTGASSTFRLLPNQTESSDHTWKPGESRVYGKPGISAENYSWNWMHTDPGFSIDGSLVINLDTTPSAVIGLAEDEFSYRWEYMDGGADNALSARVKYTHSRTGTTPDGESVRDDFVNITLANSLNTAEEKIPLPDLVNDDETLGSAETEDSPFLVVSVGLRTLINETDPWGDGSGSQTKLHTKGYMNTKPIQPGVGLAQALSVEDCPFAWEIFAPNDWGDAYMPQTDDLLSYGNDHSGYVGTSFQAQYGLNRWIIAELPTQPLLSLGELQHFDISFRNPVPPRVFNAIGNSHASPYIAPDQIHNSAIHLASYDHSYASNHVLFDDWFLSSITPDYDGYTTTLDRSLEEVYTQHLTQAEALRNSAYQPAVVYSDDAEASAVAVDVLAQEDAWRTVASQLEVEGMFNVNSTSVEAWTAVLRNLREASVPYAEVGDPAVGGLSSEPDEWSLVLDTSASTDSLTPITRTSVAGDPLSASNPDVAVVATHLNMTDAQMEALAIEIVKQVKARGPFLSLSEFVNRRLDSDKELAFAGAIESALIALAELGNNAKNPFWEIQSQYPQQAELPSDAASIYEFKEAAVGNASGASAYAAYGTPGWVRQADVLRSLAPVISARDDTFLIRAYGASQDPITGDERSKVWCEAVVQRRAAYVDATNASTEQVGLSAANRRFGRRFEIVSFRWLTEDEI